jgi:hypothetical protein
VWLLREKVCVDCEKERAYPDVRGQKTLKYLVRLQVVAEMVAKWISALFSTHGAIHNIHPIVPPGKHFVGHHSEVIPEDRLADVEAMYVDGGIGGFVEPVCQRWEKLAVDGTRWSTLAWSNV